MELNIKELREKKGLSREELAAKFGVSLQTIRNWEDKKHTPNKFVVKALKETLK